MPSKLAIADYKNTTLCIGHGKPLLTFEPDGRVIANPNLKPDEIATEVIRILVEGGWLKIATELRKWETNERN